MTFTSTSSNQQTPFKQNTLLKVYLLIFSVVWLYTFLFTTDVANWITENMLTIVCLGTLIWGYSRFKFSQLSYTLIFVYVLLHIYGAMYTYAENPFGYWLKDSLGLERNPYDRIVHFSFGFLLAYPMRDYFKNWFDWPAWVCWILPIEITLSFSGAYELLEWLVADVFFPAQGPAYLGSQGDVWDAQKDMGIAFTGAILIMFLASTLKRFTKREIKS